MLTKNKIKSIADEMGFHACGVTLVKAFPEAEAALKTWTEQGKHGEMKYLENYEERKTNFWSRCPAAKSIIVLGVNYYSNQPEKLSSGFKQSSSRSIGRLGNSPSETFPVGSVKNIQELTGGVARYAWGRDYHKLIADKIDLFKNRLKQEVMGDIYFESAVDTKPLLERTLGEEAGLGFIGKQTQLLSLQYGPWLFISELITNLELEPDQPYNGSCGTCRLCIDECPTEAIDESGEIDARKCIAYLTIEHKTEIPEEFRVKISNWVFGCDECLNACPYTAKQKETTWDELTSGSGFGPELNLLELFELKSNREHERKFEHTALSRVNRKQLLRNAAIVIGNKGNRSALPVLRNFLPVAPEMVKTHIEWAIGAIESRI